MIASTHTSCNACPNTLLCGDEGACMAAVAEQRRESRRLLDKLTNGERFAILFGAGRLDRETMKVVPIEHKLIAGPTAANPHLACSCGFNVNSADWEVARESMEEHLKKFA